MCWGERNLEYAGGVSCVFRQEASIKSEYQNQCQVNLGALLHLLTTESWLQQNNTQKSAKSKVDVFTKCGISHSHYMLIGRSRRRGQGAPMRSHITEYFQEHLGTIKDVLVVTKPGVFWELERHFYLYLLHLKQLFFRASCRQFQRFFCGAKFTWIFQG